jgi:hypothetical protein
MWLHSIFAEKGYDFQEMTKLLEEIHGHIFGSVILASLLNNHLYEDLDVLHQETQNNTVRNGVKSILGGSYNGEEYTPILFCTDCTSKIGMKSKPLYHRRHNLLYDFQFDFTEIKEHPKQYLHHRSFDTDSISFDGSDFVFANNSPEYLIRLICFPSFSIERFNCLEFERAYDNCGMVCAGYSDNGMPYDRWACKGKNYDCARLYEDSYVLDDKRADRLEKLKVGLDPTSIPFLWLRPHLFTMDVDQLQHLCSAHYIGHEDVTPYRIMKVMLRVLKNIKRGIQCRNASEYFVIAKERTWVDVVKRTLK